MRLPVGSCPCHAGTRTGRCAARSPADLTLEPCPRCPCKQIVFAAHSASVHLTIVTFSVAEWQTNPRAVARLDLHPARRTNPQARLRLARAEKARRRLPA